MIKKYQRYLKFKEGYLKSEWNYVGKFLLQSIGFTSMFFVEEFCCDMISFSSLRLDINLIGSP